MFFAAVPWRNAFTAAAEFLGIRSYTIYIVHFPLLTLISAYVIHVHGGRPLHGWLAVSGAAACVAFGCLCFEICERHFSAFAISRRVGGAVNADGVSWICCQLGAREHFAVPRALHRDGKLAQLVTDAWAPGPLAGRRQARPALSRRSRVGAG